MARSPCRQSNAPLARCRPDGALVLILSACGLASALLRQQWVCFANHILCRCYRSAAMASRRFPEGFFGSLPSAPPISRNATQFPQNGEQTCRPARRLPMNTQRFASDRLLTMNILVVGSTGPQWREVVAQALAGGHAVRALARNPKAADA